MTYLPTLLPAGAVLSRSRVDILGLGGPDDNPPWPAAPSFAFPLLSLKLPLTDPLELEPLSQAPPQPRPRILDGSFVSLTGEWPLETEPVREVTDLRLADGTLASPTLRCWGLRSKLPNARGDEAPGMLGEEYDGTPKLALLPLLVRLLESVGLVLSIEGEAIGLPLLLAIWRGLVADVGDSLEGVAVADCVALGGESRLIGATAITL